MDCQDRRDGSHLRRELRNAAPTGLMGGVGAETSPAPTNANKGRRQAPPLRLTLLFAFLPLLRLRRYVELSRSRETEP